MSDLSPETDKLLELARGASALSDARRAHIKAGLLSQIAAGGALSAGVSHASWSKLGWLSSPLGKSLSALALFSLVGVGVYVGVRSPTAAPSANGNGAPALPPAGTRPSLDRGGEPAAAPATTSGALSGTASPPVSPINAVGSAAPTVTPAPVAVATAEQPSSASASNAGNSKSATAALHSAPASVPTSALAAEHTADTLGEETRLLRDADQALRAGNAERALSLLDEHAARYPHGVLEPERTAERMIARCKLGQADAKSAQSYLSAHANSAFAARIQDACGSTNR